MKKTFLINVSYLAKLDEKQLDQVTKLLSENILSNEKDKLCWEETSVIELEREHINSGQCHNCGRWVTDREKANPLNGLCNGATVNGKLLCDECLPTDHEFAF